MLLSHLRDTPREARGWRLWFSVWAVGALGISRGLDEGIISGVLKQHSFIKTFGFDDNSPQEATIVVKESGHHHFVPGRPIASLGRGSEPVDELYATSASLSAAALTPAIWCCLRPVQPSHSPSTNFFLTSTGNTPTFFLPS